MLLDRSIGRRTKRCCNREVLSAKRSYLEAGHKADVLANFTIDSPIPYNLNDVLAKLEEWDTEMVPGTRSEKQGPYHGKLTRFIQRLQSKAQDRRLGFLFGAGDDAMRYEWMEELAIALLGNRNSRRRWRKGH